VTRRSSITLLDPRIKQEIDVLLTSGRFTLDDILERLKELGEETVSRSSLHRYASKFDAVSAQLKQTREMAAAFAQEMGAIQDTDGHKVIAQMMQALLMRHGMDAMSEENAPGAKELAQLSKAIRDQIASSAQREKLRKEIEAEANRKAADSMEKVATEAGLSAERVAQIRRDFLGVRENG